MTKSARRGFELGNHHRCVVGFEGCIDGLADYVGMRARDKGRIWWGANTFFIFDLFGFLI